MRSFYRKLFFIFIFLMPYMIHAQEKPTTEKTPATSRMQRKAAKQRWKEQRKAERDEKKAVKEHHKRIQTKETRRRMKKEKRKADKLRGNKKEFFLVRWFKYRRHK